MYNCAYWSGMCDHSKVIVNVNNITEYRYFRVTIDFTQISDETVVTCQLR